MKDFLLCFLVAHETATKTKLKPESRQKKQSSKQKKPERNSSDRAKADGMMKCEVTRERLLISGGAVVGMAIGLMILIPGLLMYTDSAPHLGFFLTVNLCPLEGHNQTVWGAPTSLSSCSEVGPTFDPNSNEQSIPILASLLYPDYPYICEVYLPAGVTGKFELVIELNGKQVASSGDLDTERLAASAAAAEKRTSSSASAPEPTIKNSAVSREEVPTGETHPKIFDVEGGEQVQVWREGGLTTVNGDFPEGTSTCPDQDAKGCAYIPFRSMRKYSIPLSTFSWSLSTKYPVNGTILKVSDVRITDAAGARGAVPEMWIEIDGEESRVQSIGLALVWIGALLLDCSPGIAYYFLTRINDAKRIRLTSRPQNNRD